MALAEHTLVMPAVTPHIGRVDEMKGIGRIIASDYLESIPILNRDIIQTAGEVLTELLLCIPQLLWHAITKVISERPIKYSWSASQLSVSALKGIGQRLNGLTTLRSTLRQRA